LGLLDLKVFKVFKVRKAYKVWLDLLALKGRKV
jgi:hypothetical protein